MSNWLRSFLRKLWKSQKFRFLAVGLTNTAFGYFVFAALLAAMGEKSYILVGALTHVVATTWSFAFNRTIVFGAKGLVSYHYLRFQLTYLVILVINLSLLITLVELLGWTVLLAQAVCLFFVAFSSYLGHKYFSFR